MIDEKAEKARALFSSGCNCAQSVLATYAEELGLDSGLALRVASGFGAGMGRLEKTCGAVTGAIMTIGLKYGTDTGPAKEKTYDLVQNFVKRFEETHGSSECASLLGCDLKTQEGRTLFKEKDMHERVCMRCVENSVLMINPLISQK
jgi:C_GCAxxG_C_C family probable redox protein